MHQEILEQFQLQGNECSIQPVGNGLINYTWKISCGEKEYILQRINTNVFSHPEWIAENIRMIADYLFKQHPDYFFVSPIQAADGGYCVEDEQENCFRLFPFVKNSFTITTVSNVKQAFEAAQQFGRFTNRLARFDASQLHHTLPDFHNLTLRFHQFNKAVKNAEPAILAKAAPLVDEMYRQQNIVQQYEDIVTDEMIPLRVCHYDTKISNVLFDEHDNGICVIDLDTVMPGYIISDVGDMLRTYLSPYSEEEQHMSKIVIRKEYFAAIIQGYKSEMNALLTPAEKELLIYSGKFMMYMQAMRFLTDFLNNNIYYQITYPLQNFYRTQNQLTLLQRFTDTEPELRTLL